MASSVLTMLAWSTSETTRLVMLQAPTASSLHQARAS
jgi:hypothetical protein